ncbi:hypothetical protein GCM10028864_27060 [Microlunatus parietis]
MDVRAEDIERIPRGNLRVPRAAFAEVWRAAELLGKTEEYATGVCLMCRWIACATVTFNGRPEPARAPITHTTRRAHEELLEREHLAADKKAIRVAGTDDPRRLIVEGAAATLRWAWKGQGRPPLDLPAAQAS